MCLEAQAGVVGDYGETRMPLAPSPEAPNRLHRNGQQRRIRIALHSHFFP